MSILVIEVINTLVGFGIIQFFSNLMLSEVMLRTYVVKALISFDFVFISTCDEKSYGN